MITRFQRMATEKLVDCRNQMNQLEWEECVDAFERIAPGIKQMVWNRIKNDLLRAEQTKES